MLPNELTKLSYLCIGRVEPHGLFQKFERRRKATFRCQPLRIVEELRYAGPLEIFDNFVEGVGEILTGRVSIFAILGQRFRNDFVKRRRVIVEIIPQWSVRFIDDLVGSRCLATSERFRSREQLEEGNSRREDVDAAVDFASI
jgi:hypothetical protein